MNHHFNMTIYFPGTVIKGEMEMDDSFGFKRHVANLEGKKIQVAVRKYKTQRSENQNKYYWGVVIAMLGNEFGYDSEEMHEALKFKFLKKEGKLTTVRSTASLTTTEFEIYLDKVKRWVSEEYDIVIPDPNEVEAW